VVVDGRLVTGQNPASATGVAEAVVRVLGGDQVTAEWVTVGGAMDAYLARPARPGRYPSVVIAFQLFGLDAHVRALADRVAALGYLAIVPDLYHRTEPRAELAMDEGGRRRGFALLRRLTRDEVLRDVASTVEYLRRAAGVGQAHTHHRLSILWEWRGGYAEGLDHARQALDLFPYCQQSLTLHQELGDREGQASTWDSLGYAHHHLGHHAQARACYQHALTLYRDLGRLYEEANTLTKLGETHHTTGNHQAARTAWQHALTILTDIDHPDADTVRTKLHHLDT